MNSESPGWERFALSVSGCHSIGDRGWGGWSRRALFWTWDSPFMSLSITISTFLSLDSGLTLLSPCSQTISCSLRLKPLTFSFCLKKYVWILSPAANSSNKISKTKTKILLKLKEPGLMEESRYRKGDVRCPCGYQRSLCTAP